jgi:predicted O-linked N-acetylglucosamine transferase (SPINDLY family)
MDCQRFIQQLPALYENWGRGSVRPHSKQFQAVLDRIGEMTTANLMQLLNFAVECLEGDEVYCEVGCAEGATLIGALLNRPEQLAYAVDNFADSDVPEVKLEKLSANLSLFDLEQQVIFCNQNFEEFFFDLKGFQPETKLGLYFYNGDRDYRSQLMGLLLAKSFLAESALIILGNRNWSSVQQASWDFLATHPQCRLILDIPTPQAHHPTFWNGIQLLSWDVQQKKHYDWSNFKEKFRNPPFIKALSNFSHRYEVETKKRTTEFLYKEALLLHSKGKLLEAECKYREVLQWDKTYADAWCNLGTIAYSKMQYEEAIALIQKALTIDSAKGIYYWSLGLVLEKLEKIPQAIQAYQKAIALNPQFLDTYNQLSNLFAGVGDYERAEFVYRQAITANPEHFGSYLNLGNMLMAQQKIEGAIANYQKARELNPRHPDVWHNLGVAFESKPDPIQSAFHFGYAAYYREDYEEAIARFRAFLAEGFGDSTLYFALAYSYQSLKQEEAAIAAYREGIAQCPRAANLYLGLIFSLQELGRTEEAIAAADEALRAIPNDLALKLERQRLLPLIYNTPEEIEIYRQQFIQQLEEVIPLVRLKSPETKKNALSAIGNRTNFYLAYQGKNDLNFQRQYGEIIHKIMAANYPQRVKPLPMPPLSEAGKIRVGYVSNYMHAHTVGKLSIGWLKYHDPEQFEIYSYYSHSKRDAITDQFRLHSQTFHHIPDNLEALCQQILADRLHVLVFTDIGMSPAIAQMASLRLAPIQCTTWGHPVTSGLSTIDYFLSSQLMEPENGTEHYSETLIRLPNIGVCYTKPQLPAQRKTRSDFQLRSDAIVYLSCQSVFKYLPQYDYIFAEIARRVPQAQFVFLTFYRAGKLVTEQFLQRLKKTFASYGLNSEDYCVMLPRLTHEDYLNLNLVSDIFLDTFSWSGGKTTLEAIACNLPVVTCPGEFMRGRHSYGILRMLGVTDTIAKDEAEYVEIAVRLGLDSDWRKSIVRRIEENHSRLYEDKTCVAALEEFYLRVVR